MAGIYFSLSGTQMTFEGYLRCGGSVNVLGIISVSVELYLGFGYKKDRVAHQAVIYGIARVTVEISILFFSKTVTLEYEKDYVQAGADPNFGQMMTFDDWTVYCDAFAVDSGV